MSGRLCRHHDIGASPIWSIFGASPKTWENIISSTHSVNRSTQGDSFYAPIQTSSSALFELASAQASADWLTRRRSRLADMLMARERAPGALRGARVFVSDYCDFSSLILEKGHDHSVPSG